MFTRPQNKYLMNGKKTRNQDSLALELYLISLAVCYSRYVDTSAYDSRLKMIHINTNLGYLLVEFFNWYCRSLISDLLVTACSQYIRLLLVKNVRQDPLAQGNMLSLQV